MAQDGKPNFSYRPGGNLISDSSKKGSRMMHQGHSEVYEGINIYIYVHIHIYTHYTCIYFFIIKIGLEIDIHSFHRPQKHLMALTRHHQVRAATAQFLVQRVWDGAPVALIFVACHLFATWRVWSVFFGNLMGT